MEKLPNNLVNISEYLVLLVKDLSFLGKEACEMQTIASLAEKLVETIGDDKEEIKKALMNMFLAGQIFNDRAR